MSNQMTLLLTRSDGIYDITNLVEEIKWSGRKGAAPRSLTVSLLDTSEYDRSGIDVAQGQSLVFYWNGVELFRGMIMKQVDSDDKMMRITAYDICRYLANNRDSFSYENKTLSYIFRDVCKRFEIPIGEVAECNYQTEDLSGSSSIAWDILCDAMYETYQYTGERYFIYADGEKVNLIKRKDSMILWVAETGGNITAYKRTRDFGNIITRVKLLGDEDALITQEINSELEEKFGIFQSVEKPDSDLAKSKYKQIAKNILEFDGRPDCYTDIEAVGITDCITGAAMQLIIPEISVDGVFYIDEDEHTFSADQGSFDEGFNHTMKLTLRSTNDIQGQ